MFFKTPPHRLFATKRKQRWTTDKPPFPSELDWGHPLARYLQLSLVMNELAGNDLADIARLAQGTLIGGAVWSDNFVKVDGSGQRIGIDTRPTLGDSGTIWFRFKGDGSPASSAKFFVVVDADFQLYRSDNNSFFFWIGGIVGSKLDLSPSSIWDGVTRDFFANWNATNNARYLYLYENGEYIDHASASQSFSMPSFTDDFFDIGNRRSDGARDIGGSYEYFHIFSPEIVDPQGSPGKAKTMFADLSANPYQFILPANRRKYWMVKAVDHDIIPKPRVRHTTEKPEFPIEIDWSHPLSKGIIGCWPFHDRPRQVIHDISGYKNHGTAIDTFGGWYQRHPRMGDGIRFDDWKHILYCGNNTILDLTDAITIEAWWSYDFSTANIRQFAGKSYDGAAKTNSCYWLGAHSNDTHEFIIGSVVTVAGTDLTSDYEGTGKLIHSVGTYDRSTASLYLQGKLDNSGSASAAIRTSSEQFQIGGSRYGSSGSYDPHNPIYLVRLWNRALSAKEVFDLWQRPFEMFRPPKRKISLTQKPVKLRLGSRR